MKKLLKTRGAQPAAAPTSGATHRAQRILVVDDDTGIRKIGAELLMRLGYQVDAAEDHNRRLESASDLHLRSSDHRPRHAEVVRLEAGEEAA